MPSIENISDSHRTALHRKTKVTTFIRNLIAACSAVFDCHPTKALQSRTIHFYVVTIQFPTEIAKNILYSHASHGKECCSILWICDLECILMCQNYSSRFNFYFLKNETFTLHLAFYIKTVIWLLVIVSLMTSRLC